MDIVRFKGGLGNQMFQYSFLRALSSRGRKVGGSLGFYTNHSANMQYCLDKVFANIDLEIVGEDIFREIDEKWRLIKQDKEKLGEFLIDYENRFFWVEEEDGKYNNHVFETKRCAFVGYWQTEKYFKSIRNELLNRFQFSRGEEKMGKLKERICSGDNYISVHVRRGDYLQNPELYGGICTNTYYESAIRIMKEKVGNPIFIFLSDDISWVKEHWKLKNAIYIEASMFKRYQDWYDMCLMSCCSHNIIANSSFSWWGAWLNRNKDKIVIAPKKWLNNRETPDIWCDDWILI